MNSIESQTRQERERRVAIARDANAIQYPAAPFAPPQLYPEFQRLGAPVSLDSGNRVYPLVRETLRLLGLDAARWDTPEWNPFRDLVHPGESVALKPNLVFHEHPLGEEGFLSMVTHASVIRPLVDYLLLAAGGDVKITICDAPLQSADLEAILQKNGLADLLKHYHEQGVSLRFADLRREIAILDEEGLIVQRKAGAQKPQDHLVVNLGTRSALYPIRHLSGKLEITDYPPGSVARHHHDTVNEYLIGSAILDCDLFINVPKLKTHKKAGITAALKNLIGINGDKSWIAHHRRGSVSSHGDEYKVLHPADYAKWHFNAILKRSGPGIILNRMLRRIYRRLALGGRSHKHAILEGKEGLVMIMEGSWIGNDTVWRTILDLNNILFFADRKGVLHDTPQRRYLVIADAILAGEKNGPMEQCPKPTGMILGGFNPVALDCAAGALMGFHSQRMPQIRQGFRNEFFPLCPVAPGQLRIESNLADLDHPGFEPFLPPYGWAPLTAASTPFLERMRISEEDAPLQRGRE